LAQALAWFANQHLQPQGETMIKFIASIAVSLCVLFSAAAGAQEFASVADAKASATEWLTLVDAGKYSESWHQAASRFQSLVGETTWRSAVGNVRAPLGKVVSRKLTSAVFTHTLPGAPDGNYVVIQYATQFEHKANAIETVTPSQESDGSWKVSGYYVK
jgi:hypothetical protein